MITRCANPVCQEELHYLRNGRIIAVNVPAGTAAGVEHFWLCGTCCQFLDFDRVQDGRMRLRPKLGQHTPPAASMRKPPAAEVPELLRLRR
jgi:hypothetical protein